MTERTEELLRAALRADVEDVDVDPDAWRHVQRQVAARRSRTSRSGLLVAAGIIAVAVGVGAMLVRDDETAVDVRPADDAATSTPSTTAPRAAEPEMNAIWPFLTMEQVDAYLADPGVGMFLDGEATALEFGREYLGMPDPVVVRGFQSAEGFSGSIDITSRPGSPMTTTVWVHRYGGDDGAFSVYFAETDNIRPDPERHGVTVGAGFIEVRGSSTAFEAHVDVEVRDAAGTVLGRTFVMGGANGEFAPYEGEVAIEPPSTPTGVLILSTSSAEDGSVQEATLFPVRFADGEGEHAFSLFFHRDEELVEVRRTGPKTAGVLRQALEALVAGPLPEDGEGISSMFSAETADVLAGVSLRDGTAIVDFADLPNGASTSAGSTAFLTELDATIFQFPTVERIEYRLQGSCEAFWEEMQHGSACPLRERD